MHEIFKVTVKIDVLNLMSWLFDIFILLMCEKSENQSGECRCKTGNEWNVFGSGGILVADDTVFFAESEEELERVEDEFYGVCTRKKLKVNAGKCKVMPFERRKVEWVLFGQSN